MTAPRPRSSAAHWRHRLTLLPRLAGTLAAATALLAAACTSAAPAAAPTSPPAPTTAPAAAASAAPASAAHSAAPATASSPLPASSPVALASPSVPLVSASPATAASPGAVNPASVNGSITVYGALTDANGTALAQAFQAVYPNAKVSMVTAGTGPLVTRIQTEQRAGGVRADVILLADPTVMPSLNDLGVLSSYTPAAASQLPAGLKGTGWVGAFTFNNIIVYHTGTPAPTDWSDLTKPDYKDKLEIGDPSASGTTLGMVGYLSGTSLGWDYFKALKANGATVVQSTNTVGTDVAQGSMSVGITLDSVARPLVAQGSPIQMVWPSSGAIPVPAPESVVKGHESPTAQAFVDWLLTPEGQAELVKLGYAPAIGQSNAVPAGTKLVDVNWSQITSGRTSILDQFKSIFG